jgi:hypothetical protein
LLLDIAAEQDYVSGYFVGENSEPLVCSLENGVVFQ